MRTYRKQKTNEINADSTYEPTRWAPTSTMAPAGRPLEESQSNLVVGRRTDRFEREADRVADLVDHLSPPQRPPPISSIPVVAGLQRQAEDDLVVVDEETERGLRVQPKAEISYTSSTANNRSLISLELGGAGRRLPHDARRQYETRLGRDLSRVRVHTSQRAHAAARDLHAYAFTVGSNIYFRRGFYEPATPSGQRLLTHELVHTIQQGGPRQAGSRRNDPVEHGSQLQRADCNFYVYDSTEDSHLGTVWAAAARARALGAYGGYAIASGKDIPTMVNRILAKYDDEDCDCTEEIQFWSHGSSGNGMWISGSGDELTASDFNIPEIDRFGGPFPWEDFVSNTPHYQAYALWFSGLSERHKRLVSLQQTICGKHAEVYYRSCEAFQGEAGHEFAKASAHFWRSRVVGHTKIIGLTQPGRRALKPGEEPHWSETEGVGGTEMKKRGSKPKKKD